MSARDGGLPTKLRAALFLVTGRRSVGEMLSLAGGLAHVLEDQLLMLLELQLVVLVDPAPGAAPGGEPLPVVCARIQLLKRIEAAGIDVRGTAAALESARTLPELASHARAAAVAIQEALGRVAAEEFWAHARTILLHWQDREAARA